MTFNRITSFQNARVKQVKKLRDKRARMRDGRFVLDDSRDLERALDCGYVVDYAFYAPQIGDDPVVARLEPDRVYEVTADLMQKASYRQSPSSVLAVMVQYPVLDAEALAQVDAERVLVLVDLRKPGNIGALLRTADATGFRAVLLVDTSVDIYNPNVIRSSTGASFLHNIYDVTSQEAAAFLEARGYRTLAAVVDGETSLFETNLRGKTAVILGTEDHGLPDFWMKNATQCVRIPMVGSLSDSLNVSVSGAVMMYEVLRQQQ